MCKWGLVVGCHFIAEWGSEISKRSIAVQVCSVAHGRTSEEKTKIRQGRSRNWPASLTNIFRIFLDSFANKSGTFRGCDVVMFVFLWKWRVCGTFGNFEYLWTSVRIVLSIFRLTLYYSGWINCFHCLLWPWFFFDRVERINSICVCMFVETKNEIRFVLLFKSIVAKSMNACRRMDLLEVTGLQKIACITWNTF